MSRFLDDNQTIATHGTSPRYWYSVEDSLRLLVWIRQHLLNYENVDEHRDAANPREEYTYFRENTQRVLLTDPYHTSNFANYFTDDISRITATDHFATVGTHPWTHMPTVIIIPVLSGLHWRTVVINVNYATQAVNVLFDDPYGVDTSGKAAFPCDLQSLIIESIRPNVIKLINKQNNITDFSLADANVNIIYTCKEIDQQGHGQNSWDCGPIIFSNIQDYIRQHKSNAEFPTYHILAYIEETHDQMIRFVRALDIDHYSEVAGIDLDSSRLDTIYHQIEQELTHKKAVAQAAMQGIDTAIISLIEKLSPAQVGQLFQVLENKRLVEGQSDSTKKPYTKDEVAYAYQIIAQEGKGIRADVMAEPNKTHTTQHDHDLEKDGSGVLDFGADVDTKTYLDLNLNIEDLASSALSPSSLQEITLKFAKTKTAIEEARTVTALKDIEKREYQPLIKKLAYKKTPEEQKILTQIFENLGDLHLKLAELTHESYMADGEAHAQTKELKVDDIQSHQQRKQLDKKYKLLNDTLKYYTDASILYQYVLSVINEKLESCDTEEMYTKLAGIKCSMLSAISMVDTPGALKVSQVVEAELKTYGIREEVEKHKAVLINLREHSKTKVEEIEHYRLQSQSSEIEDAAIKKDLQSLYVDESRKLFEHIAGILKVFLANLYQEAESELASVGINKPCDYAVMGLGSLALQQATPYSDLEFAILLEHEGESKEEGDRIKEYFRNLTHLVHFKVINLGETVIAQDKYNVSLDHLVHRGVNFDLGGKTPLGRIEHDKPYDLVQTVEKMLWYVHDKGERASHIDKNLPHVLERVCYVYGNKALIAEYKNGVTEFLHNSVVARDSDDIANASEPATSAVVLEATTDTRDDTAGIHQANTFVQNRSVILNCEARAIKILKEGAVEIDYTYENTLLLEIQNPSSKEKYIAGDLHKLRPLSGDESRLFDVKQEIYRLPDRLIYNLGLHYGIQGGSGWDIVDILERKGIITSEASSHLKYAITFATTLRLKTYIHNKGQIEDMSLFAGNNLITAEHIKDVSQVFHLSSVDLKETGGLFRYFYTALPLHEKLKQFCDQYDSLENLDKKYFFSKAEFYVDDNESKGLIHYRLLQYQEAQINLETAIEDVHNIFNLNIRNMLGRIYDSFGNGNKAIQQFQYCLDMHRFLYKDELSLDGSISLNNIGSAYNAIGDYNKAIKYYTETLKMRKQIYKDTPHPAVADTFHDLAKCYISLGEYDLAIDHLTMSLEIKNSIYKDKPHVDIASSLCGLGVAYKELGMYDKAIDFYTRSLEMQKRIYKGEPDFSIAASLTNLGSVYSTLQEHDKAIDYCTQSLKITKLIHKNIPHKNVVAALTNLGAAYMSYEKLDAAIEYFTQSLEMEKQIYNGELHSDIADSLNNLGAAYCRGPKEYSKAIECFTQSLEMYKHIYKDKPHLGIAAVLKNLGNIYRAQSKDDEAVKYYTQALEIYKTIYKELIHPDIAHSLNDLGEVYCKMGQHEKAMECHAQSLEMSLHLYKNRPHPDIARSLNNMASMYRAMCKYDAAINFCIKALYIMSLFPNNECKDLTQTELLKIAIEFSHKYSLDVESTINKIFSFAMLGLNFMDYKTHYAIAQSSQSDAAERLDRIIEQYRLALIFVLAEDVEANETVKEIYHNLSALTGVDKKNIELWIASGNGNVEQIKKCLLLEDSHDINVDISICGTTPLIQAIIRGDVNIVFELLQTNADVNKTNNALVTPLCSALGFFGQPVNVNIVTLILEHNADPNKPVDGGYTPMHLAYIRANLDVIRLLLHHGANVNPKNNANQTPLHCLLKENIKIETKLRIIEEFLDKYDVTIKDQDNKTVVDYAREYCPGALSLLSNDEAQVVESTTSICTVENIETLSESALSSDPSNMTIIAELSQPIREEAKQYLESSFVDIASNVDIGNLMSKAWFTPPKSSSKVSSSYERAQQEAMASMYTKLGEYSSDIAHNHKQGLKCQEHALEIEQSLHKSNHHSIAYALNNIGTTYYNLGHAQKSLEYFEKALEMYKQLYNGNHPTVANSLANIGHVYQVLGEVTKSLEYSKQSLAMMQALYQGSHPDVAVSLNNLGNAYKEHGEIAKSLEYFEQALKMKQELYPYNHPAIVISLNNIGCAYQALGEDYRSLEYLERALEIHELHSINHRNVALLLNNMGTTHQKLKNIPKSVEYFDHAIKMFYILHSGNHPDIVATLNNMGGAYKELGDTRKSLEYSEQALKMAKELYFGNHPTVATCLSNVADVYHDFGDLGKSLVYSDYALKMRQALYPHNHHDVASSLSKVGNAHRVLGNTAESLKYYEQALKMYRELHSDKHHETIATSLNDIAGAYHDLGDTKKSLEYAEQALKMGNELYHGNHHTVATYLINLGSIYQAIGDTKRSLGYFEQALKMCNELHLNDHTNVATVLNKIGYVYKNIGDTLKSLEYFAQALKVQQKLYEGNHINVVKSLNNIGTSYQAIGEVTKGLVYLEQALKMVRELHSSDHAEVALLLNNIGTAYREHGESKKGLEYLEQALKMLQALYPGNHLDVAQCLGNVGCAYQTLGEVKQSLAYKKQALKMYQVLHKGNHHDVAWSLDMVGYAYQVMEDKEKSLEYYKCALQMRQALYLENNSEVADSLSNVGLTYHTLGEIQESLKYYQKALKMRQELFSGNHPKVAASLNDVARAYHALGKKIESLAYQEQALEIVMELYPSDYSTAQSVNNVGIYCYGLRETKKSAEYFEQALKILQKLYIGDHFAIAHSLNNLGIVYEACGEIEKGLGYRTQALQMEQALKAQVYTSFHNVETAETNSLSIEWDYLESYMFEGYLEKLMCEE